MRLIDNPFKLLDVTPSDNVNIINQNAEDKAFMDDENERLYEDARTTLLSPTKRIAAEVGWIYDRNIDSVINDINNGIVNLNNCDCLEKVNFLIEVLYKCELNKLFSVFVSLDQCYRESGDSNFSVKVLNRINSARQVAGIPVCDDASLIQNEIKLKLGEINSAINYLFGKLKDDDLIKITNLIAANTIEAGTEYGQVIDSLINQYAIHFSDDLTRKKELILSRIEGLKNIFSESGLYSFCEEVRIFDNEAQPIQLFLQKSGQSKIQVESNEVAYALRDFAGYLIEKNNIDGAITLINLGIEVFPELPDIFNVMKEDRKVLFGLKIRQTEFSEIDKKINDGWNNVQCDVKYAEQNKQYLMRHAPYIKAKLDEISKKYSTTNDTNSDQYFGGCMNCAYYYSQLGNMLSWGALFFDAIDSFTKSKFFAEKCNETETVEKANSSISSLYKLISNIGRHNIPRLATVSTTKSSYTSNTTNASTYANSNTTNASTYTNSNTQSNNSYTNSDSAGDTSGDSGFPFKTVAIFAFVILLVYSMLSGNDKSDVRRTSNVSTVNSTSQSIITTAGNQVAEAKNISTNNNTLSSLNGRGKVVVWDDTKNKEFSHSSLDKSLLWSMGDTKKYVVIIDHYDATQVSTYTRSGSSGSSRQIPGIRNDAVLYVYDLSIKKCLGQKRIIGNNPPEHYRSKGTPTAIYGDIAGPIARWINSAFSGGSLGSSYSAPTAPSVPQASVIPKAPIVPKINQNAIVGASHSSADQEGSYIHSARLAVDGNTASCWSEGAPGLGIGESIIISFDGTYEVNGMLIWPGHQKTETLFYQNARPSVIRVVGSDGYSERCYISDRSGLQRINFNRSMNVSSIQLIIEQAKPGTKYADTCIAEVEFF